MVQLCEKWKPKQFADIVGQVDTVKSVEFLAKRGLGGNSFWFSGLSGTGKTCFADLIALHVAGDVDCVDSIDAGDCTINAYDAWRSKVRCKPMFGTGYAFVVNEAHLLKKGVVSQLLTRLEPGKIPDYATVVFTTTLEGEIKLFDDAMDISPLMSRGKCYKLESRGPKLELAFACHLRKIADSEGLGGKAIADFVSLVRECKFNLRQALQRIETGEMIP